MMAGGLQPGVDISAGSVSATSFSGNGSGLTNISAASLAANSVTSIQIAAGSVDNSALAGNAVTSAKVLNGTLVDADINADASIADTKLATLAIAGKVANSATTATSANTAGAIVARDAGGNFAAGTVTATAFVGDGSGLTNLPSSEPPTNAFPAQSMVWIKPGTFLMGSPTTEQDRVNNETQHPVTLTKGFWMGVHEVTQAEYLAVAGSNPSLITGDLSRPVDSVSWASAMDYCVLLTTAQRAALRITAGWQYRLPTEAEWEYCARAGARTTRFGHGDDLAETALGNYAWFDGNSGGTSHPVGQKLGNAWGLMDMHGNVFEWCVDSRDFWDYPGGSAAVTDPLSLLGGGRVLRGGSWGIWSPGDDRCAFRLDVPLVDTNETWGFRVVLSPNLLPEP